MSTDLNSEENLRQEIGRLKERVFELEKAEKQTGDTLKKIFQVAPIGIGMLRNRIFIETNKMVSDMTGYSREELLGKSSRILYKNDSDYNYVGTEKYRQINETGTGTVQTSWQKKDGTLIDIQLSSTPVDNTDLEKGVIFTALDITKANKAKLKLQSSEERLKIIFDNAPDGIFLYDSEGNIVDGNRATERLIDQQKEQLIGKNFLDIPLIDKQDTQRAAHILKQNRRGDQTGPDTFELNTIAGKKANVEVRSYPIQVNNEQLFMGVARDMEERMRAQEFKRDYEQRMAFHINQTPLAVVEWDLNFSVKSWNPSAERIFGYTKEEAIGQHVSFFIPQKEMKSINHVWSEVTLHKESRENINNNRRKDGETIVCEWYNTPLIDNKGNVISVASFGLEITKRIRSEKIQKVIYDISKAANSTDNLNKLIRQIQKKLASIIDTTNFYIALYDDESDTLTLPFFADQKDQFTKIPAGKSLTAHVIRNNKPLLANKELRAKMVKSGEIEPLGSKSEVWLGVPLQTDGEVFGVLAVQSYTNPNAYSDADMKMLKFVSDQISLSIHRKNTELKIAQALEKAKEADRLKSAFLANMSHEIRTPMNGILGFANLLKNESISDADRKQYITIIEQSGKRMLNIINDLIDISKIESGMTEAVISDFNLNNSLEYVYSFFKPEAEAKGLELSYSTELENTAALIKSDREKVYAVLINLVKNAIKYTHKGKIHFSYHIKNSKLTVVVKDTGIGIPQDKLETVFNRFVQADSNLSNTTQEGVGLGLAITKAFTKLLKGKIWVESEYEKGSTFYFEIPYIKGEDLTQTDETDNIMTDNKPNKKLKILVAEDDAINRKLFSYTLKDIAEELILVPNGAEAVKTTQERKDIDLVLMDLKMPVMDGYEATLKIREEDKEIVIIALSAFAMDSERKKAMELGFNSYVSKPISKNDLIKAVREYFDL